MYSLKSIYQKPTKTLCLLLITAALFCGLTATAFATTYPADHGKEAAAELQTLGILKGTDANGTLEIERQLTRAEALTIVQRICNVQITETKENHFTDTKNHWAAATIESFYQKGLINGTGGGAFEPNRNVTCAEYVKMTLSCMGYENLTLDTAYAKGIEIGLLNGFGLQSSDDGGATADIKSMKLTRGQTALISANAIFAKQANGTALCDKLIADGVFKNAEQLTNLKNIVDGKTTAPAENIGFADSVNSYMPQNKNYMISPMSLKIAMAMAANGANGETQAEIIKALNIDNLNAFNSNIKDTFAIYDQAQAVQLKIANSLWQNTDFAESSYKQSFLNAMQKYYSADMTAVNNNNMLEKVNGWVSDKTNGKIKQIIDKNAVNNIEYQNILLNAVYFKGAWKDEFNANSTVKDIFTNCGKTQTETDFMNKTSYMSYGTANGVQAVKLPYQNYTYDEKTETNNIDKDVQVSMYILLADKNIQNPEQVLNSIKFDREYVQLSLPKFKVEYSEDMVPVFAKIGITKAFSFNDADFGAMLQSSQGKAITHILHKTYITVDEKGTEAAAVTGIGAGASSAPPPKPVIMKADHPFTFIIRDDVSGNILFMGQINTME